MTSRNALDHRLLPGSDSPPVEWQVIAGLSPYEETVAAMEARAGAIADGVAGECVWLLEHPPLYTAGTSARHEDLVAPDRFPVHQTGRGGQYTITAPASAWLMSCSISSAADRTCGGW